MGNHLFYMHRRNDISTFRRSDVRNYPNHQQRKEKEVMPLKIFGILITTMLGCVLGRTIAKLIESWRYDKDDWYM